MSVIAHRVIGPGTSDRDRTFVWAVVVSILLHIVALVPYLHDLIPQEFFEAEARVPQAQPIEFELVSPPEDPTPTERRSRYLSTVSSQASDLDPEDTDSPLPKSEGVIPVPDTPSPAPGEEGGGERELPPLPETKDDLGAAFQRSRFTERSTPSREQSRPLQAPEFRSSGSARASFGGLTLNTTAWDFAPYLLDLKQRVKEHWIPPIAFTALGLIGGYTQVNFRIYPDGRVEGLGIVGQEGHESLHKASLNAVKGAAPFLPLPDDFPEEYLDITFGFYYLLPGDEEKYFKGRNR